MDAPRRSAAKTTALHFHAEENGMTAAGSIALPGKADSAVAVWLGEPTLPA
jgi:hypothetical protein